jgi:putative transposase
MEKLVESLGITRLSKSQASEMAKDLDEQVAAFGHRPLGARPCTFVAADALVLKVREGGRVVDTHALVATEVNNDGHREILGLQADRSDPVAVRRGRPAGQPPAGHGRPGTGLHRSLTTGS